MKKALLSIALFGITLGINAQNEVVNGTLTVKSNSDNILTLQSTDNSWLYTNWMDKNGSRKAYMGFDPSLTDFRLYLQNGANKFTINGGNVGIGNYNPNSPLHVSSEYDAILTLQSTDDTWLYTNWQDKTGTRRTYMGLSDNLSQFRIYLENGTNSFTINGGNVGIGTYNPGSWKLAVNGKIRAKEIKVETSWSDFVFYDDYELPTLQEVENHIKEKGHLKDIPSAKEVEENGIFLGEMDSKLLQKIEELTLYTIQQEKEILKLKEQNYRIEKQEKEILELKSLIAKILESKK